MTDQAAEWKSLKQFGGRLAAVIAYGESEPTGQELLVLVDRVDAAVLDAAAAIAKSRRKRKSPPPIVMEQDFLARALDSYPIEILSMKARYQVLEGADPLAALVPEARHVRLQCERELRGKLLLFRRAYLEAEGAPKQLQAILAHGVPSVVAILRGMLYVRGGRWNVGGEELRSECVERLRLPRGLLDRMLGYAGGKGARKDEVRRDYLEILTWLEQMTLEVDRWTTEEHK